MRSLLLRLTFCVAACSLFTTAQVYAPLIQSGSLEPAGYKRYQTEDALGRSITFFLSQPAEDKALPLVTFILGSGAYSNFLLKEGKLLSAHAGFLRRLAGRARLLIVEKPGARFGERHAVAELAEFRREHTLGRWVEAITAALVASRALPEIDTSRTVVIGHSEGAEVAAAIAVRNPFVTDVACLAGGSLPRIYSFVRDARRGIMFSHIRTAEERVARFWDEWREINEHADDPDRLYHGHAYRYWTSFASASVLQDVSKSQARVFIAEGSLDNDDPQFDADLLNAALKAMKRDVTAIVIDGADHGFQFPAESNRDGWGEIQDRIIDWIFYPPK